MGKNFYQQKISNRLSNSTCIINLLVLTLLHIIIIMKKQLLYIISFLFLTSGVFAENLKATFTFSTFYSPSEGPYIETYLSVVGNSVKYIKNDKNNYQGTIEVTLLFKQGEEIKSFKKYNLKSPEIKDSLLARDDFMDQQRISLPNGKYDFEIIINDVNTNVPEFKSTQSLTIDYSKTSMAISDIELLESITKTEKKNTLSKSGYDLIPYSSDFYPEDFEKIAFYAELYNTDKVLGADGKFLINYSIIGENNNVINNYRGFIRETAKSVTILLKTFNIKDLPSGNYYLAIEAKNKDNETLIHKKIFFQRSNPKAMPLLISEDYENSFVANMTNEELTEYISSCEPTSTNTEINFFENQLKGGDVKLMKQYFYNFWLARNPIEPEVEWNKYKELVKFTHEEFSTQIKKGYETDRGRIYLKYGKPNSRQEYKNEPSVYPYEMWHYYGIKDQNNIRLIFYNPDLISNDYPMLHSNLRGEINNDRWENMLHYRTTMSRGRDRASGDDEGGDSRDNFNNPR